MLEAYPGPIEANKIHFKQGAGVQGEIGQLVACQRIGNLFERKIFDAFIRANRVLTLQPTWPKTVADCQAKGLSTRYDP